MTKTITVSFETLKGQFEAMFKPPLITEVYYKTNPDGWCLQFFKNGYYIKCNITRAEIIDTYRKDNAINDPIQLRGAIQAFESYYLKFAIEILAEESNDNEVEVDVKTSPDFAYYEKTYIKDPSEAPEGANVKRGPRGGYYYDSGGDKGVNKDYDQQSEKEAKVNNLIQRYHFIENEAEQIEDINERRKFFFDGIEQIEEEFKKIDLPKQDFEWIPQRNYLEANLGEFEVVDISPDEYLNLAQMEKEPEISSIIEIYEGMTNGEMDMPFLKIEGGKVIDHEGRHRAWVARKMGLKNMKVAIPKDANYEIAFPQFDSKGDY